MRILFRNIGQAEFYLKTSKRTLADNLIAPDGGRLPTQRVRNALCKGLGYSSYDELKFIMSQGREYDNLSPSPDDLHRAFSKGFSLALAVAEECGFQHPEPADTLALRLAGEFLRDWR
jgi:hypothetical protein